MIYRNVKVLGLSSGDYLAKKIAKENNMGYVEAKTTRFADGEIIVTPQSTVRHCHVIVIQSLAKPVNESLMELLICIDALKRANANTITVFIPYYAYARQDRKACAREPITSKLVAKLIEAAGATRVCLIDIHSEQTQGFFDIPADVVLAGCEILYSAISKMNIKNIVVVAPDYGGVKRARQISEQLNCKLAILDKRRPKPNVAQILNILGNVKNKDCIICDDMIDTAGTIVLAAQAIKDAGAKSVTVLATHGVLSGPAIERLTKAFDDKIISKLYISNTIPSVYNFKNEHVKIVDLTSWMAGIIKVLCDNKLSLSEYAEQCRKKIDQKVFAND